MEIFENSALLILPKLPSIKETGKSRGFGFVDMKEDKDGKEAIEHLNDISLGQKPLVVKQAEERQGGGGGGGYRGGNAGNNSDRYNRPGNRDRKRY